MKRYLNTRVTCLLALGLFHLGATFFVRASNLALLAKTRAITSAGFLAIPNQATLPPLHSWEAALCGALFFTLTSGALALCVAGVAPLFHRFGLLSKKKARALHAALLLIFWALLGPSMATAPLLGGTAGLFALLFPSGEAVARPGVRSLLFHTLVPLLLALCLAVTHLMLPRGLFSGFRDAFLFDNPAGNAVRHFYYTYTLFPAEAFKRLDQKSQITVCQGDPSAAARLIPLKGLGHLPLSGSPCDYTLATDKTEVVFTTGETESRINADEFSANPAKAFRRFSRQADRFGNLRTLTWYALFTAFPLLFYLLFHTLGTLLAGLFCPLPRAARTATLAVATCAVFFIVLLAVGTSLPHGTRAALDALARAKGDTASATQAIVHAARHDSALVRYRAALAAHRLRDPRVKGELLIRLAADGDTNVVCQALGAMGQAKDRRYLGILESAVRSRPEWYVQWYGYRAMGRLGWHPSM